LSAAHAAQAPWPVAVLVSSLQVIVPGFGAALSHLLRGEHGETKCASEVRYLHRFASHRRIPRLRDQGIRRPARRAGPQKARPVALTTTRQSTLAGSPQRLRDRAVPRVGVFHIRLREGPLLVGAVGAVPDLGLGSRAAEAGVVQALA
jgi:hypothetical protein